MPFQAVEHVQYPGPLAALASVTDSFGACVDGAAHPRPLSASACQQGDNSVLQHLVTAMARLDLTSESEAEVPPPTSPRPLSKHGMLELWFCADLGVRLRWSKHHGVGMSRFCGVRASNTCHTTLPVLGRAELGMNAGHAPGNGATTEGNGRLLNSGVGLRAQQDLSPLACLRLRIVKAMRGIVRTLRHGWGFSHT